MGMFVSYSWGHGAATTSTVWLLLPSMAEAVSPADWWQRMARHMHTAWVVKQPTFGALHTQPTSWTSWIPLSWATFSDIMWCWICGHWSPAQLTGLQCTGQIESNRARLEEMRHAYVRVLAAMVWSFQWKGVWLWSTSPSLHRRKPDQTSTVCEAGRTITLRPFHALPLPAFSATSLSSSSGTSTVSAAISSAFRFSPPFWSMFRTCVCSRQPARTCMLQLVLVL